MQDKYAFVYYIYIGVCLYTARAMPPYILRTASLPAKLSISSYGAGLVVT